MINKNVVKFVLTAYLVFIIFIFIFIHGIQPLPDWMINYNLIPFHQINEYTSLLSGNLINTNIVVEYFIGNFFMFLPMGILFSFINENALKTSLILLSISLLIESIEFITRLGSFDVDCIILNMSGGILGLMIYKLLKRQNQ